MKKVSLIKKIASLIIFVAFYVLSIATSNFPYPEFAKNPTLSLITSIMALLSFLLLAVAFCKSKKFLIAMSVFFAWIVFTSILLIFDVRIASIILIIILYAPIIIFTLPFTHFQIALNNLFDKLNINDDFYLFLYIGILIILFYATYFISRKIANRKTKKQIQ